MVSASTGVMNSLLGKLTTLMGKEFSRMKNLRKEVKYIHDELRSMKDALGRLADVDEPDPQTKSWRNKLRELSYDIEDIIDDFIQNIGEKDNKSGFFRKMIRRLKTSRARHRIAGQIEEIKKHAHETGCKLAPATPQGRLRPLDDGLDAGDRRAAARGGWRSTSQARSARRGAERRLFSPSRWKEARSGGPADDPSRMAGRGWGAGGRWIRSFSGCALPGRRTVSMARCLSRSGVDGLGRCHAGLGLIWA